MTLTFWPWSVVIHGGSHDQPLHQVWRSYGYPIFSYGFWHLPQDTIVNAFAATAHAPYHVTYVQEANFSHIFQIHDPDLSMYCASFVAIWWCLRAVYWSTNNVKTIFGRKFQSTVEIGPKNGGFGEKWGVNVKLWFYDPEKAHPCAGPRLGQTERELE